MHQGVQLPSPTHLPKGALAQCLLDHVTPPDTAASLRGRNGGQQVTS